MTVSLQQLRAMGDAELAEFCMEKLGLAVSEKDELVRGNKVVGYKRSRLLTRVLQLAVSYEN